MKYLNHFSIVDWFIVGVITIVISLCAIKSCNAFDVGLTWTPSTDADRIAGYYLYEGGEKLIFISGGITDKYTLEGLTEYRKYSFTLRAATASGIESIDSNIASKTFTEPAPTPPTGLSIMDIILGWFKSLFKGFFV